jgi:hypothetical protein
MGPGPTAEATQQLSLWNWTLRLVAMFQHRTLNGGVIIGRDVGTEMEGLWVTRRLCRLLVSRTGRH